MYGTHKPNPNIVKGIKAIIFLQLQEAHVAPELFRYLVAEELQGDLQLRISSLPFLFLKWDPKHDRAGTHCKF